MTVKEMVQLALSGYKPNEIAELHKLTQTADPEIIIQPKQEPEPQPNTEPIKEPDSEPTPQPISEPAQPQVKEPEIDYKKLYEETREQLAAAQKSNLGKDMSGNGPSDQDILANLVRGYM